jgi:hypothetical protein
MLLDALQGLVDLVEELSIAVPGPQPKGGLGFLGTLVRMVGHPSAPLPYHADDIRGIPQELLTPGKELPAEVLALELVHIRLVF